MPQEKHLTVHLFCVIFSRMMFKIILEKSHLKNRFKIFVPEISGVHGNLKYFRLEKCYHHHVGGKTTSTKTWRKSDIFSYRSGIWREYKTIFKTFECLKKN